MVLTSYETDPVLISRPKPETGSDEMLDIRGSGGNNHSTEPVQTTSSTGHSKIQTRLGYTLDSEMMIRDVSEASVAMGSGHTLNLSRRGLRTIFKVGNKKEERRLGASGVVYNGSCGSLKVAVKRWNWMEEYGLALMQREVAMYVWIWKEKKELLEDVLPRFLAVACPGQRDVTLITEFVGWPLEWKMERVSGDKFCTVWSVNGKKLTKHDMEEICSAATEGLRKLVLHRVWHGDEEPRNMRVQKCERTGRWRVWWIDLGNSNVLRDKTEEEIKLLSSRIVWKPEQLFYPAERDFSLARGSQLLEHAKHRSLFRCI